MAEQDSRRPSEWRRLFRIAVDPIDQLQENVGGYATSNGRLAVARL
jgi:hypothetical protein